MSIRFSADEVLEMAEQIERNGGVFYRHAAEFCEEGREMLLDLAKEEDKHLALFQGMRSKLSPEQADTAVFDPDGEGSLYLNAMADGHVFDLRGGDPAKILKGNESILDICQIAIHAEKDSIVFFAGMKDMVPESLGKEAMDVLIREEMKHIRWLHDRLTKEGE